MPSLSQETSEIAVIKLSLGGVDFRLIPSCTGDAAATFSISKLCNGTGEVDIDLNNFVGTLRIKNHYSNSDIASSGIVAASSSSSLAPTKNVNHPTVSGEKRAPGDDDDDLTLEQLAKKKRHPTVVEPLAKRKRITAEYSDYDKMKSAVEEQQYRIMIGLEGASPSSVATFTRKEGIAKSHDNTSSSRVDLSVPPNQPKNRERYLVELIRFREIHGHCNVPDSRKNPTPLGTWVKNIRSAYRRMKNGNHGGSIAESKVVPPDLIERLDGMGFEWGVGANKESVWMTKYKMLKEYAEENGHCLVPLRSGGLGRWVHDQRYQYNKKLRGGHTRISPERIQKLNEIGFEWVVSKIRERDAMKGKTSSGDASAGEGGTEHSLVDGDSIPPAVPRDESLDEDNFDKLVEFRDAHGHCDVPLSDAELGPWVKDLRAAYAMHSEEDDASLSDNFIERLEEIGFRWTIPLDKDAAWAAKFEQLKQYAEANGDCFVPLKHKELGLWVRYQRSLYSKRARRENSPLTDARIAELESIGFEWKILKHPKKEGPVFI